MADNNFGGKSNRGGRGNPNWRGPGRGRFFRGSNRGRGGPDRSQEREIKCFKCQETGHYANKCPQNANTEEQIDSSSNNIREHFPQNQNHRNEEYQEPRNQNSNGENKV